MEDRAKACGIVQTYHEALSERVKLGLARCKLNQQHLLLRFILLSVNLILNLFHSLLMGALLFQLGGVQTQLQTGGEPG